MKHYNIILNNHNLEVILDTKREHWYILFPSKGQYISGSFNDNGLERIHHPFTVVTRQYELVLDPNDDQTQWESFSVFDCKKQMYIDTAQGKII
jgi:hypothetical protein